MRQLPISEKAVEELAEGLTALGEALVVVARSMDPKYHMNSVDGLKHDIRGLLQYMSDEEKAELRAMLT